MQESSMPEKSIISIANENDEVVETHIRGTPLKQGTYPMIAAVLLLNSRGHLIMQKIALHKRWGGLWSYSAAGHVDAGENYKTAAKRELKEEMGIDTKMEKEILAFPLMQQGKKIAFHHVFLAHSDAAIIPDKSEVAEVREISLADLKNEIASNPKHFFDGFLVAVKHYLKKE